MATQSRNLGSKYNDFVKLTDVQNIVQDMIFPMLNAMKTREADALALRNTVTNLATEVKKNRADVRQALLMKTITTENQRNGKKMKEDVNILYT